MQCHLQLEKSEVLLHQKERPAYPVCGGNDVRDRGSRFDFSGDTAEWYFVDCRRSAEVGYV